MSGHSKWSKVKHKKAVTDSEKSREFSKLAKLISSEARKAGGNAESPGVKAVVARAKRSNMPAANIKRAVRRGAGSGGAELREVVYEGYGPGGCALVIRGLTDNKNRVSAEIRRLFREHGANLAEPGAASWAFEKNGESGWAPKTTVALSAEERGRLAAFVEALEEHDDIAEVYTNAE